MPRVKVARKSTAIDMTAMCDVAFLLLTFFILTAKPKVDDLNMITISVGENKAFYSVTEQDVRQEALKAMGDKYGVSFTPEETRRFSLTQVFGVPMKNLKSFLDTDPSELKNFPQTGIPAD